MTSTDHNDPRRLIVFGVLTSVAAIVSVPTAAILQVLVQELVTHDA